MSRSLRRSIGGAFRYAAPPLTAYYAMALAVPLGNGAWHAGRRFVEHGVVVLILPPLLILSGCVVRDAFYAWVALAESSRRSQVRRRLPTEQSPA